MYQCHYAHHNYLLLLVFSVFSSRILYDENVYICTYKCKSGIFKYKKFIIIDLFQKMAWLFQLVYKLIKRLNHFVQVKILIFRGFANSLRYNILDIFKSYHGLIQNSYHKSKNILINLWDNNIFFRTYFSFYKIWFKFNLCSLSSLKLLWKKNKWAKHIFLPGSYCKDGKHIQAESKINKNIGHYDNEEECVKHFQKK